MVSTAPSRRRVLSRLNLCSSAQSVDRQCSPFASGTDPQISPIHTDLEGEYTHRAASRMSSEVLRLAVESARKRIRKLGECLKITNFNVACSGAAGPMDRPALLYGGDTTLQSSTQRSYLEAICRLITPTLLRLTRESQVLFPERPLTLQNRGIGWHRNLGPETTAFKNRGGRAQTTTGMGF